MRRPPRTILQALRIILGIACKPLVTGLRADAKATAKLASIEVFVTGKPYKFFSQTHGVPRIPRHGDPPRLLYCQPEVLPMSPHTCYPCVRSIQPRKRR